MDNTIEDGYTCNSCGQYVFNLTVHNCPGYKPIHNQEFYFAPPCEHCYCIPGKNCGGTTPHRQCCHCAHELSEEFIFGDE